MTKLSTSSTSIAWCSRPATATRIFGDRVEHVDLSGPTPVRTTLFAGSGVHTYTIAADGSIAAVLASDGESLSVVVIELDEALLVEAFSITRDGARVLIHVRHEIHGDAPERLYLGPLDGSSPAIEVGPPGESVARTAQCLVSE